ncbi:CPBP family glutamic-type intramembrane protease [Qipengyuania soli]|uniref:CPBP family intramembrane metalloprotease n=1 Tax=Qipengyuania soli TaxID=2782568 RepID=A0A7S8F3F4_9SPHN|nr:CPBP family glutamic-type intramembrane protease [Qipengyuania soli]QPC98439.1 CPBP family intramembrane metalloprotease [Qipengyuania soli]
MEAITTSGQAHLAPANSLRGEWSRFFAFLKRPTLPDRAAPMQQSSFIAVGRMLVLDLIIMVVLLGAAFGVMALGVNIPKTAISGMDMTPQLAFAAIVFAPVAEEIAFRSWLSGRPGHVLFIILALVALAIVGASGAASAQQVNPVTGGIALVVFLAGLVGLWVLRGRDAMGWFQKLFPLFYWFSAIAFAGIHLLNFSVENMATILPLVLPQFVIGLVLGYLRVNYGLWSNIMLHMLHNAAFITLVAVAGSAGA